MKERILFLDDNPYEMQGYADKLKAEGFDVVLVTSTDQAIEVLKTDRHINLMIIDLIMPYGPEESIEDNHRAGVYFCKMVRENLKISCPIIVFSVLTEEDVLRRARQFADLVLSKSVLPSELVGHVKDKIK